MGLSLLMSSMLRAFQLWEHRTVSMSPNLLVSEGKRFLIIACFLTHSEPNISCYMSLKCRKKTIFRDSFNMAGVLMY